MGGPSQILSLNIAAGCQSLSIHPDRIEPTRPVLILQSHQVSIEMEPSSNKAATASSAAAAVAASAETGAASLSEGGDAERPTTAGGSDSSDSGGTLCGNDGACQREAGQ